jgi:sugar O-acyltransferase (sialic acid O-acetyltransferase NeuD family)
MTKEPILLVGAGGHARACIDVIEQEGNYFVKGLTGLSHEIGSRILDYPVIGADEDLPVLLKDYRNVLIAIGQIETPDLRMHLFDLLQKYNCALPTIVSPRAYVSPHAKLGIGTIVMHGSIVNAGAEVGENCIINSQSLIEHDVVIEDHCHIATAAKINGGVRIGKGTFIGSNSSVRQCINIGERCIIGMGQQVLADCEKEVSMPCEKS